MRVRVLYFAAFREAVGVEEQPREIPERCSVGELWGLLSREIPLFARFAAIPPAAVNRTYVGTETLLSEGDEVAFLPPVAGG